MLGGGCNWIYAIRVLREKSARVHAAGCVWNPFFLSYAQPFTILALLALSSFAIVLFFALRLPFFPIFSPLSFCFLPTFETGSVSFPSVSLCCLVFYFPFFLPSSSFNFCIFVYSLLWLLFLRFVPFLWIFISFVVLWTFVFSSSFGFFFWALDRLLFYFTSFPFSFVYNCTSLFFSFILINRNTIEFLSASASCVSLCCILFSTLLFLCLIFFFLCFHSLLQTHIIFVFYLFHLDLYSFLKIIPIFISLNLYMYILLFYYSFILDYNFFLLVTPCFKS